MKDDKDISFIAQRYREGRFSVEKGLRRLNMARAYKLRRLGVAAAVTSVLVLSATAAMIWRHYSSVSVTEDPKIETVISQTEVVKVIDFENASLPAVIKEIKEVYGVEVVNLPENAWDYRLSLHYEGNAVDLVNAINEILETQMRVKE